MLTERETTVLARNIEKFIKVGLSEDTAAKVALLAAGVNMESESEEEDEDESEDEQPMTPQKNITRAAQLLMELTQYVNGGVKKQLLEIHKLLINAASPD